MPSWMLEGFDGLLAVDIGGTNIRVGLVETNLKKSADLAKARVWKSEIWRHGDEKTKRDEAVDRLIEMLQDLIRQSEKAKLGLAPVIGIGCPGLIREDGSIETGAQNLPGNWESSRFNLASSITAAIAEIGKHETAVVIHNDAVVQGLSELPNMVGFEHWGALTIGTGLGNAWQRQANRALPDPVPIVKAPECSKPTMLAARSSPGRRRRWMTTAVSCLPISAIAAVIELARLKRLLSQFPGKFCAPVSIEPSADEARAADPDTGARPTWPFSALPNEVLHGLEIRRSTASSALGLRRRGARSRTFRHGPC